MQLITSEQICEISGGDPFGLHEIGYALGHAVGFAMRSMACSSSGGGQVLTGAELDAAIAAGQAADSSGLF